MYTDKPPLTYGKFGLTVALLYSAPCQFLFTFGIDAAAQGDENGTTHSLTTESLQRMILMFRRHIFQNKSNTK